MYERDINLNEYDQNRDTDRDKVTRADRTEKSGRKTQEQQNSNRTRHLCQKCDMMRK